MRSERRQHQLWKNLFLVRHGESTANEVNRFAGAIDAPLTDLGKAQARRAGRTWHPGHIDQIYVSPLTRARQTADIILNGIPSSQLDKSRFQLDERIVERHFGDFTLENKTRLQRRFGLRNYEASLYQSDASLHGGESFDNFRERILDFLKHELYPALEAGRKVLVVAHKYVIELISRLILRLPEAQGYDLRLPNARILGGDELQRFVKAESQEHNLLKDWIVVHHSSILAGAAVLGLLLHAFGQTFAPPSLLLLALLMAATAVSLARVSLKPPAEGFSDYLLSPKRLLGRFVLLPWLIVGLGAMLLQTDNDPARQTLLAVVLLLAAPAATTAITLTRSAGGMILPAVFAILVSTAMSSANTIGLLAWFGMKDLALQGILFIGLSLVSLAFPLLLVSVFRRTHPISTAKFAEDQGYLAVLALAAFVVVAFQNIQLASFYPNGVLAIALGVLLRLLSVRLARHKSLYGLDDYFAMSYPNIFLVILLASLTGNPVALELATWFLVPMFALAPLDDWLIPRLQKAQSHFRVADYLDIGMLTANAISVKELESKPDAVSPDASSERCKVSG